MKKMVLGLMLLFVALTAFAETVYVYDKSGITVLYRVENNLVYEGTQQIVTVYKIEKR